MAFKQDEFQIWNAAVGELISSISSPNLPALMQDAICRVIPFEHMMIYGYRTQGRPLELFFKVEDSLIRKIIIQHYIAGSYLLDPFYNNYKRGVGQHFYRLSDVKPDGFRNSEYNLTHYSRTGIYDEVVLYVELDGGLTAAMSLTRGANQPIFNQKEVRILDKMAPVISSFIRHHWVGSNHSDHAQGNAPDLATLQDHIQNAFRQFGRTLLTNRESETIGLILSGYSSSAIAEQLEISVGTVKIHRKNAYQKLSVSSQNELFSMFLASLSDPKLL